LSFVQSGVFVFFKTFFQNLSQKFGSFSILTVLGMKGKISATFAEAKGGEYMNPTNHAQDKQRVFDSFCKTVLRNELRDYYDEIKRLRDKEISFSELSEQELEQLSTTDKYFVSEQTFKVLGNDIIVKDESIAEALRSLPERKRDIILLYYFLELPDGEIGKKLNMIRSKVQYHRANTLQELKKLLEEENADENK